MDIFFCTNQQFRLHYLHNRNIFILYNNKCFQCWHCENFSMLIFLNSVRSMFLTGLSLLLCVTKINTILLLWLLSSKKYRNLDNCAVSFVYFLNLMCAPLTFFSYIYMFQAQTERGQSFEFMYLEMRPRDWHFTNQSDLLWHIHTQCVCNYTFHIITHYYHTHASNPKYILMTFPIQRGNT